MVRIMLHRKVWEVNEENNRQLTGTGFLYRAEFVQFPGMQGMQDCREWLQVAKTETNEEASDIILTHTKWTKQITSTN